MWLELCETGQREELVVEEVGDFPGGPVVKTLHFHCRGLGFNLWSRNKDPTYHLTQSNKQKSIASMYN